MFNVKLEATKIVQIKNIVFLIFFLYLFILIKNKLTFL